MNDTTAFAAALIDSGLIYQSGIPGVYGQSQQYSSIVASLNELVDHWGMTLAATKIQFPPVVSRNTFEHTNYIQSFPDLMGAVYVFTGDDHDHAELCRRSEAGKDWSELLEPSNVFLSSAACHPVYPMCTGMLSESGCYFNVQSYCFRHEPSTDPARMQCFQMHEVVFVGAAEDAQRHRDSGLEFGVSLLQGLGLDMAVLPANDPFFGRLGTSLAANQRDEVLKLEGVAPIGSPDHSVAIISGNCHRDHFGVPFAIEMSNGTIAHSSCVAFGIDRIVLALLWRHGLDPDRWPSDVEKVLWP